MKFNNITKYLTERHKLSLRNIRTGQEIWHLFLNRLNILLAGLTLIVILFVVTLSTVAYTPILDLIPGYPGNKARQVIIENIGRLDSLEQQVSLWEKYNHNMALIFDGQSISTLTEDSVKREKNVKPFPRSISDSLLRLRMQTDSNYMLVTNVRHKAEVTFQMVTPVRGAILKQFNPKTNMFGVEIAPQPNQGIMAVMDGTVIATGWEPETGYSVTIQHAGNMVSIYKRIARKLCKTGERVKSGEAIALTPSITQEKSPLLIFELWYNGNAVDPENYITF